MTIDLNHVIVRSMMARPAKFADNEEMDSVLGGLYNGRLGEAYNEAMKLACQFVRTYSGSFAFINNLKRSVEQHDTFPTTKLKGVLNVMRAEALAQRDGRVLTPSRFNPHQPQQHVTKTTLDISGVIPGDYAIPLNGQPVIIHVEKPGPNSKWHDWVFISGGTDEATFKATPKLSRDRLGSQRPGDYLHLTIADPALLRAVTRWAEDIHDKMSIAKVTLAPPTSPATKKKVSSPRALPDPDLPSFAEMAGIDTSTPEPEPEPEIVSIRDKVKKRYGL